MNQMGYLELQFSRERKGNITIDELRGSFERTGLKPLAERAPNGKPVILRAGNFATAFYAILVDLVGFNNAWELMQLISVEAVPASIIAKILRVKPEYLIGFGYGWLGEATPPNAQGDIVSAMSNGYSHGMEARLALVQPVEAKND